MNTDTTNPVPDATNPVADRQWPVSSQAFTGDTIIELAKALQGLVNIRGAYIGAVKAAVARGETQPLQMLKVIAQIGAVLPGAAAALSLAAGCDVIANTLPVPAVPAD
jgi:hypothetical protein